MDATFLAKITNDFSEFRFLPGKRFLFRAPKTIIFDAAATGAELLLLHEVGHAILGHRDFRTEIERLKMERAAWEKARELAKKYEILFDEDFVETELDSYRDWLDKKSRCPDCGLTRFQSPDGIFHCPQCENLMYKRR